MHIVLKPEDFCVDRINYETVSNTIIDGYYNKLIYCDDIFTMRGIFIQYESNGTSISQQTYKDLCNIESTILNSYVMQTEPAENHICYKLCIALNRTYNICDVVTAPIKNTLEIKCIWETKSGRIGIGFTL